MGLSIEQLTGLLAGGTSGAGLSAVMAAAGQSDPALGAVLEALARQGEAARDVATDTVIEADTPDPAFAELEARFDRLRDIARRMDAELRALRRRTAHLAAALGACAQCWGEDPECGTCGGQGHPGSAPPHRGHYFHYVAPLRPPSAGSAALPNAFPRAVTGLAGAPQD